MGKTVKTASPPPAEPSPVPSEKATLSIADVANIFIRLRRHRDNSKSHHVESSSGDARTYPALTAEGALCPKRVPISRSELFVCLGAVDVAKLLRAVRASLFEKAIAMGANVLVDEQWKCTICGPKNRSDGTFRVHITYSASASRSEKIDDPQKPVALDQAKGVPGLMTIISRH